jgi:hypothetical protein
VIEDIFNSIWLKKNYSEINLEPFTEFVLVVRFHVSKNFANSSPAKVVICEFLVKIAAGPSK